MCRAFSQRNMFVARIATNLTTLTNEPRHWDSTALTDRWSATVRVRRTYTSNGCVPFWNAYIRFDFFRRSPCVCVQRASCAIVCEHAKVMSRHANKVTLFSIAAADNTNFSISFALMAIAIVASVRGRVFSRLSVAFLFSHCSWVSMLKPTKWEIWVDRCEAESA